jgi:5-methylcytosine-specific restriction endonuclease McrA
MPKIELGVSCSGTSKKIYLRNIRRRKIMDSRRRKKRSNTDATEKTDSKPGVVTYLKKIFMPCCTSNEDETYQKVPTKPTRKAKIPLAMKQTVWVNQFGEVYKHKCVTKWCHRIISVFDFEVGHNIPESKGGATSPENLRPICRQCNIGMGNRYTIDEWSKKEFLKK